MLHGRARYSSPMPRKPPNVITAYATFPVRLSIITRWIVPSLSPLLRRTGVPSTLSLAIKRAVSRAMTSGPTVAVIITSLQNADTGKTTASDGKFRQDFAKKATFLCGVDVLTGEEAGGGVALGDSLTDGTISTIDAFCRWPDQLARRLAQRGGPPIGVMNNGLGGNRILHDLRGDSGLNRLARDVLSQPGVTHPIVMLGTNDLRNRWAKPDEEVTGEQMIAGLQQMAVRAHSRGVKLIGATLTPFGNETFMADAWNPTREKHRVTVNKWIRESGAFDGVADFDAALRDPEIPTQMRAVDDCGDGLHPSDSGYCKMGDAIDLALLD